MPIRTVHENEVGLLLLFDVSSEFKCYFNMLYLIILFDVSTLFPLYLACIINKDMKLSCNDNGITTASSRKREEEKYKLQW